MFPWGQRSGTLRSEIDRIAAAGGVPLLELETERLARGEASAMPEAVTIFVDAPIDELERRLRARATESSGEIEDRIALARRAAAARRPVRPLVENDDRERAAAECVRIVNATLAPAGTMAAG